MALTARQRRAIDALMIQPTVEAAAESCGVHRATLFRWLADASFCDELRAATDGAIAATARRLSKLSASAVTTLSDAMAGKAVDARQLREADLTLTHSTRLRETYELAERISALEARQTT